MDDEGIAPPRGRDGNYVSQPDLAGASDGSLVFLYSRVIPERDPLGHNYQHIYGGCIIDDSYPGGNYDITPGSGFDASFGALSDLSNGAYEDDWFVYQSDPYAGSWITGDHPYVPSVVRVREITFPCLIPAEGQHDRREEARLADSYPNPFNAVSNFEIRLTGGQAGIAQSEDVSLKVYDLLGQEVATVIDERLPPGTYTLQWDATGHPSGVYFYRLTSGSFIETRKLVLLR